MNSFTVDLFPFNKQPISITMRSCETDSLIYDSFHQLSGKYVYSDLDYSFLIKGAEGIDISNLSVDVYINDTYHKAVIKELPEGIEFEIWENSKKKPFLGCFGLAKIIMSFHGTQYVSDYLSVMVCKEEIESSVEKMVDYIYDHCGKYLYEQHEKSRLGIGFSKGKNVSIDSKLSILEELKTAYSTHFAFFQNAAHKKLVNTDIVSDFSRLQSVSSNTIRYITTHVDELETVNYDTGIHFDSISYQPRKTLVKSTMYTTDTFENQVIVCFLKTVVLDLENMINQISRVTSSVNKPFSENEYIESMTIIYDRQKRILSEYLSIIQSYIATFQQLYLQYQNLLHVSPILVSSIPEYSSVFSSIIPYKNIYRMICEWFSCVDYDLAKTDLILSFVSVSKIYEYFCLLKLCKSIEALGYELIDSLPYQYNVRGNRYYVNTRYNNTFYFENDGVRITLYFQPMIRLYDKSKGFSVENNLHLFRNSSVKTGGSNPASPKALPYTPDYIIKIERPLMQTRYVIMDAKFMILSDVYYYEITDLVFKYLFATSTNDSRDEVLGLCVLYGKEQTNSSIEIHDSTPENYCIKPSVHCLSVCGTDVEDSENIIEFLSDTLNL